ncbi:MAG: LEA type 2 family protein [Halobacteria archaeon]
MELPLDAPLVRRVSNEWGEITDDYSEIRTRVVLDGASLVDVHVEGVGLRYDATMNGVRVARSEKKGVSLNRRNTTIHLSARIPRDRLIEWWQTHVNNGERTRLVIRPHLTVDLPSVDLSAIDFAGVLPTRPGVDSVSVETPNYTSEFETSIADSVRTHETMRVKVLGKTVFAVQDVDAWWGTADEDETPLDVRVSLRNPNPFAVGFEDLRYTVTMNGVDVGEGAVDDFTLPARGDTTVTSRAVLNNQRIADWWTTHLRREERTRTEISFDGTVTALGFSREIGGRSYSDSFRTDLFAGSLPS